jgi:hypothetical protein
LKPVERRVIDRRECPQTRVRSVDLAVEGCQRRRTK